MPDCYAILTAFPDPVELSVDCDQFVASWSTPGFLIENYRVDYHCTNGSTEIAAVSQSWVRTWPYSCMLIPYFMAGHTGATAIRLLWPWLGSICKNGPTIRTVRCSLFGQLGA